jgi:V8-like Glu-specific endopeptidase
MSDLPELPDMPLSSEELRRRPPVAATEDVPEKLRELDLEGPPAKDVRRIERPASEERRDDEAAYVLEAHRPAWMPLSFAPKRARAPEPPIVMHHGQRLEPMFIWWPDDRSIYNDLNYPWGCVCKITTAAGAQGSGVLIGPRHVLTASHCVDWNTEAAERIDVHLQGTTAAATAFDTIAYAFTHITGPDVGYTEMDEDYAALVLDQRLGDRFGWMGTRTYNSSWDDDNVWRTIGYPTDVAGGTRPTYQRDKSLDEDEFDYGSGRAMTTSADIMKGQSGSPMFAFFDDNNPYVVAVVSSAGEVFASGDENWCAGGVDLDRIVRRARDENP